MALTIKFDFILLALTVDLGPLQADAEESLAEAMPALAAAREALSDLDKSSVTEIR